MVQNGCDCLWVGRIVGECGGMIWIGHELLGLLMNGAEWLRLSMGG